jgi:hypothetical protein
VSVRAAVERELASLGTGETALGAGALVLAERLDDRETNSSAVPAYQRELRETLAALRVLAAVGEGDRMTEFERRLEERKKRSA